MFSRYGWAVAMKTRLTPDIIIAFKEIIEKIGKPKSIAGDSEGGTTSTDFIRLLNENNIKHIFEESWETFCKNPLTSPLKNPSHSVLDQTSP